jgi:predicted signal transduction protein with EAL and GGDEF domain
MNPHPQSNGAPLDASPFLAMILCEVLELRAMTEAQGIMMQALVRERGATSEQALAHYRALTQESRRKTFDKIEVKLREIWPDHLHLLKALYRDVS